MKSKFINVFGVIICVSFIAIIVRIGVYYYEYKKDYNDSLDKATEFAKNYLEEKHQHEMVYIKHTSIYDKMIWTITFAANSDREKTYTVSLHESYDRDHAPEEKIFTVSK